MLLNLTTLVKNYRLSITGVIHVGAHHGQEVPEYMQLGIKNIALFEPCAKAFTVLQNKYGSHHHIRLFNYACATHAGYAEMYTETANQGQSNSLLKPVNHLLHYPEIKFTDREQVKLVRLDAFGFDKKYNLLNIDTQGTEVDVLIGAEAIMHQIDYIYTEVNKDDAELYEIASGITAMDNLLKEFERVETVWTKQGWGDGLYIRKTKLQI